jgi:hypothetical protein
VTTTHGTRRDPGDGEAPTRTEGATVHVLHAHTLHEIELLRSAAAAAAARPAGRRHRRRVAPRRQRVQTLPREHPQLTVFSVDADEIASQLAHDGGR